MAEATGNTPSEDRMGDRAVGADREAIREVIDLMRAAVLADGGDIELVDVDPEGVVSIRFHGACVGCPSSSVTLQSGIERNLRRYVPGVKEVIAVR